MIPRIVTFCAHQPFLHLFSKVPVHLDLIQIEQHRRFLQNWDVRVRPLPEGWQVIDKETARERIRAGHYHLCLAHNISDYMDFMDAGLPLVLIMHTSLSSRFVEEKPNMDKEHYRAQFAQLVSRTNGHIVFVTQTKKDDWQLAGDVIVAGLDPEDYPAYEGEKPRLLRVTNHLIQRAGILGYRTHRRLSKSIPIDVVGENPGLPGAEPAASWQALKAFYRGHRAFLHTAIPVMEDGFNLAVLEAMATGMPVVATANPTSPIENGVNGYIDDNLDLLRANIERLIADREHAQKLGTRARETVRTHFHYTRFARQWMDLIERLLSR